MERDVFIRPDRLIKEEAEDVAVPSLFLTRSG
jgi:hypothetical protein